MNMDAFCDVVLSYTTEDFENWTIGIGTLAIGFGTSLLGYAAIVTIPRKIGERYKDKDLITLYQRVAILRTPPHI